MAQSIFSYLQHSIANTVDPDDADRITGKSRKLGLVVVRGTQVSLVSPEEGTEEIANPFISNEDEELEE